MKIKIILFIILEISILESVSQVEFRLPFDCQYIKELEENEFQHFVSTRYSDQLYVYNYLERAQDRYLLCPDSATYFRIKYAQSFRDFLMTKDSRKELEKIYLSSLKKYPDVALLCLNEYLYQNFYLGHISKVDSATEAIHWNDWSTTNQQVIARKLFLLMDPLISGERIEILKSKMSQVDTVMKIYDQNWSTPGFSSKLIDLYRKSEIIEANMIFARSMSKTLNEETIRKIQTEIGDTKYIISEFGFKVNIWNLEKVYLTYGMQDNRGDDFFVDYLRFVVHKKDNYGTQPQVVNIQLSTIELIILSSSVFLLLCSFAYWSFSKYKKRKLDRWLKEELQVRSQSLMILYNSVDESIKKLSGQNQNDKC